MLIWLDIGHFLIKLSCKLLSKNNDNVQLVNLPKTIAKVSKLYSTNFRKWTQIKSEPKPKRVTRFKKEHSAPPYPFVMLYISIKSNFKKAVVFGWVYISFQIKPIRTFGKKLKIYQWYFFQIAICIFVRRNSNIE